MIAHIQVNLSGKSWSEIPHTSFEISEASAPIIAQVCANVNECQVRLTYGTIHRTVCDLNGHYFYPKK